MKSRLTKLFLGLALAAPVLSGCTIQPMNFGGTSKDKGTSGVAGDTSIVVKDSSIPANADAPTYSGDKSRKVQTINNTPVSKYSQKVLDKIAKMVKTLSRQTNTLAVDTISKYMIELGIGEAVATKLCDSMIAYQSFVIRKDFNAKSFIDNCYDTLAVLNSIDVSKISKLLTKLNQEYESKERARAADRLSGMTILKYYSPYLTSEFSYDDYLELNRLNDENYSYDLYLALNDYRTAYDSYYFSQEQIDQYNRYLANLQEQVTGHHYLIPEEIINFIDSHASDMKSVLVNDLKLIVDAFGNVISDYVEIFRTPINELTIQKNDIFGDHSSYSSDNSYNRRWQLLLSSFVQNKNNILGLLNSILSDKKLANLLLDLVLDYLIPTAEKVNADDSSRLMEIRQLKTRVSAINSNHVSALASFIFKLLNQVQPSDLLAIVNSFFGPEREREGEYNVGFLFDMGDKYINKLDAVISALTAKEKSSIIEASQIFGIDIINELQNFSVMYKSKDLSTEDGYYAFTDQAGDWAYRLRQNLARPFSLLFSASESYGGYASESSYSYSSLEEYLQKEYRIFKLSENVVMRIETSSTIYQGSNISNNLYYEFGLLVGPNESFNYSFSYYYSESYYYNDVRNRIYWANSSGTSDINGYPDYARNLLNNYSSTMFTDMEYSYLQEVASLNLSLVNVSLDTSKIGYIPLTVYFRNNGALYTVSFSVQVRPNNLPNLSRVYNYSSDSPTSYVESKNSNRSCRGFQLNSLSYITIQDSRIYLDTSVAGWHYYFNGEYYFIYYVVDTSRLNSYLTSSISYVGTYLEGSTYFNSDPYVEYTYDTTDARIEYYRSLDFDYSYVLGKTSNRLYSMTVNGITYEYVIVSKQTPAYTRYDFVVDLSGIDQDIVVPSTVSASVRVDNYYEAVIEGMYFYYGGDDGNSLSVTLTDFTYINGIASFTYNGRRFVFDRYYY